MDEPILPMTAARLRILHGEIASAVSALTAIAQQLDVMIVRSAGVARGIPDFEPSREVELASDIDLQAKKLMALAQYLWDRAEDRDALEMKEREDDGDGWRRGKKR